MNNPFTHWAAEFSAADDFVVYQGKVFEAGEYPDKEFSLSEDELSEKASAFEGVDLDLEHSQFHDLLGHRLGRLEKIWRDGRKAVGRLSIPRWLHDLSGGKLQTSLTFDRAKNIVGCALTLNPRIADAEVAAAFTASLSQSPEPTAGHHPHKEIQSMPTSFKDRLKVLFGKAPEALEEAGIDPSELERVEFTEAQPKLDPGIQAQLADFKATNDRLIAGQLNTAATLFADEVIRSAKAVPAQREHLISLYKGAAIADGQGTVKFSEGGQIAEGPNMKALRELFKEAHPHSLFSTQIPNADPNAGSGEPDPAMVEKLRAATSLGQQTLKKSSFAKATADKETK